VGDLKNEEYLDLIRKCATIISKSKNELEIMDINSFQTLKASIDEALFNEATVNDQVTYVKDGKIIKVIEVRKR
jgi:hypothetical protein